MARAKQQPLLSIDDLMHLTAIWDLAALDRGSQHLDISAGPEGTSFCSFSGVHCSAVRRAPVGLNMNGAKRVTVSGALLRSTLLLFDDGAPITVTFEGSDVKLASGDQRRATVRLVEGSALHLPQRPDKAAGMQVERDAMLHALNFLSGVTAQQVVSQILAGVLLEPTGKKRITLLATDKVSRAGAAAVSVKQGMIERPVLLPVADTIEALKVLDTLVRVSVTERNHLLLSDDNTVIQLTVLSGDYPNMGTLPSVKQQPSAVPFPADLVRVIEKAATLFDAGRAVQLNVTKKTIRLEVQGQQLGDFVIEHGLDGTGHAEESVYLDASILAMAAKMAGPLTLRYGLPARPVLLEGKGDVLWLMQMTPA